MPRVKVTNADGTPVDPNAMYFVLWPALDPAAYEAMQVYIDRCTDDELRASLRSRLEWMTNPRRCTCPGRRTTVGCPIHDVNRDGTMAGERS